MTDDRAAMAPDTRRPDEGRPVTVIGDRTVQRENLCRSAPFTLIRTTAESGGDGLTFEGYGLIFDSVTTVDSWEGTFEEVIVRGATRKSLREVTPKIQFDHGRHPLIGSIPIGRITEIGEDDRGLHVVARLTDNWLIQPVRDALAEEAIDGMSFRFSVVREEWHDANGKRIKPEDVEKALWYPSALDYEVATPLRRTLKEIKVPEVGPVVWPQYTDTTAGVRSVTIDLGRLGDPETRKNLARAVYAADAAENGTTRTTDAPPTHQDSADEHPSEQDAPPATETSPGEHPSRPSRDQRRQEAHRYRGYVNGIRTLEGT